MIAHLSSEQLSEYMVGRPGPGFDQQVAKHVQNCPACRAELANFREALGEFRGAVRAWSKDQANEYQKNALAIPTAPPDPHPRTASHQLAWAVLIAIVCVIASFVVPRQPGDNALASDAVLLNRVDTQVSRTVPSSMEPLMKLVAQE
jgi:anti-sigma factor RsiW